ncbi:MAG: flagellar type III secretion system pore protein FliP, partial [Erysipelotrichaceae bacterium]
SSISLDFDNTGSASLESLDVVFLLLFLSIIPSLVLMMTSFTRIIIVFSFLRNALGLQQSPPNQILVGLSLFLTLFIMGPVISDINENAYIPYKEQAITQEVALDRAQVPIKEFMLRQVDNESLELFISISKQEVVIDQSQDVNEQMMELDLSILVPAFVTSELKRAFLSGFLIYIPFLAIDLIVASTLMSMGMVMLPPGMISLPFKVMVFILANGWGLLMSSLVQGFH